MGLLQRDPLGQANLVPVRTQRIKMIIRISDQTIGEIRTLAALHDTKEQFASTMKHFAEKLWDSPMPSIHGDNPEFPKEFPNAVNTMEILEPLPESVKSIVDGSEYCCDRHADLFKGVDQPDPAA